MSATTSPRADFVLARSDTFQSEVRNSRKADRTTLLDVYREGYALRLIEVLTTDYPGLIAMVGSASFDDMARPYVAAHPSRHPSVRWFGRSLTDFLESTAPYNRSPAAAEMAHFEWELGEAWDAPDMDALVADMTFPEPCDSLAYFTGEAEAAARAAGLLRAWVEAWMIGSFPY